MLVYDKRLSVIRWNNDDFIRLSEIAIYVNWLEERNVQVLHELNILNAKCWSYFSLYSIWSCVHISSIIHLFKVKSILRHSISQFYFHSVVLSVETRFDTKSDPQIFIIEMDVQTHESIMYWGVAYLGLHKNAASWLRARSRD